MTAAINWIKKIIFFMTTFLQKMDLIRFSTQAKTQITRDKL